MVVRQAHLGMLSLQAVQIMLQPIALTLQQVTLLPFHLKQGDFEGEGKQIYKVLPAR